MASPHGGESWQCCRRARKVQPVHRCQVLGELGGGTEDQLLVGDHRHRGCCGRISSLKTPTGREVDGARDSRPGCTRSRFERPEYLSSCSRSKPSSTPSSPSTSSSSSSSSSSSTSSSHPRQYRHYLSDLTSPGQVPWVVQVSQYLDDDLEVQNHNCFLLSLFLSLSFFLHCFV